MARGPQLGCVPGALAWGEDSGRATERAVLGQEKDRRTEERIESWAPKAILAVGVKGKEEWKVVKTDFITRSLASTRPWATDFRVSY